MNVPDAVAAVLYVMKNSDTFTGSNALYGTTEFKRGYPQGQSVVEPLVAVWQAGGSGKFKGAGRTEQWRTPRLRMDVLAASALECERIYQKCREALIADADDRRGHLHDQGIKDIQVSEPHGILPWDDAARTQHLVCDIDILIGD